MIIPKPKGIGGWMLLPIFGMILSIYFYSISLNVINLLLILYTIFVLVLIFNKFEIAPKFAISFLWINVLIGLYYVIILFDFSLFGIQLLSALIWTFYWTGSKRVKNTFINKIKLK